MTETEAELLTAIESPTAGGTEDRIERFVRTAFDVSPDDPGFDRATDLFDSGYVDSVGLAELLEFISEEFGVEVPESDLLSEEFATIQGMARIINRHGGR